MNKFEKRFMQVCERFKLNPSNWLPHIKPDGLYEMGTSYDSAEAMVDDDGNLRMGKEVAIECFSLYNAFWLICYTRRTRGTEGRRSAYVEPYYIKKSKWEALWSFLSDVDMGIYDTTNWAAVGETDDENGMSFRAHKPR